MNFSLPQSTVLLEIYSTLVFLLPSWTPGSVSFFSVVFVFLIPLLLVFILFLHRSQFLLLYLVTKHHLTQRRHRDFIKAVFKNTKNLLLQTKISVLQTKSSAKPKAPSIASVPALPLLLHDAHNSPTILQ